MQTCSLLASKGLDTTRQRCMQRGEAIRNLRPPRNQNHNDHSCSHAPSTIRKHLSTISRNCFYFFQNCTVSDSCICFIG